MDKVWGAAYAATLLHVIYTFSLHDMILFNPLIVGRINNLALIAYDETIIYSIYRIYIATVIYFNFTIKGSVMVCSP